MLVCILAVGFALSTASAQEPEPLPAEAVLADPSMVVETLPPALFRGRFYEAAGQTVRITFNDSQRIVRYQLENQAIVEAAYPRGFEGTVPDGVNGRPQALLIGICTMEGQSFQIDLEQGTFESTNNLCTPPEMSTRSQWLDEAVYSPADNAFVVANETQRGDACPPGTSGAIRLSVVAGLLPEHVLCSDYDGINFIAWTDDTHLLLEETWNRSSVPAPNRLYVLDIEALTLTDLGYRLRDDQNALVLPIGAPPDRLLRVRVEPSPNSDIGAYCVLNEIDFATFASRDIGERSACNWPTDLMVSEDQTTATYVVTPLDAAGEASASTLYRVDLATGTATPTSLSALNMFSTYLSASGRYALVTVDDNPRSAPRFVSSMWFPDAWRSPVTVLYDLELDRVVADGFLSLWTDDGARFVGELPVEGSISALFVTREDEQPVLVTYHPEKNETRTVTLDVPAPVAETVLNESATAILLRLDDDTWWVHDIGGAATTQVTLPYDEDVVSVAVNWDAAGEYLIAAVQPASDAPGYSESRTLGRWLIDPLAD